MYGLRISEVVFDRPVLNLLTLFLPVLLTLVNLGMYFTLQLDIVILILYCCTFLLTIWQIVRVAEPVIAPKWLDERARHMYYRGCVKQMRNDRPLFPSVDRRMKELWDSTLASIDSGDARVTENIGLEMDLAAQLLCTKRHDYQNYLIELSNYNDPLTHMARASEEQLFRGRFIEGAEYIRRVFYMLNCYGVVNISNHELIAPIDSIAVDTKYLPDAPSTAEYQNIVYALASELLVQGDLYLRTDLGKYRLFKSGVGNAPFLPSSFLADYYSYLMENERISTIDKDRLVLDLYDKIRMFRLENPLRRRTWDDVSGKRWPNVEYLHRDFTNACLATMPFALLMLAVMESGKDDYVKLFRRMNLDDIYFIPLWIQCLLSLVYYLICGCKSNYVHGLKLSSGKTVENIRALPIKRILSTREVLEKTYAELVLCVNFDADACVEAQLYRFHPMLNYGDKPKRLIDAVFRWLLPETKVGKESDKSWFLEPCVQMVLEDAFGKDVD